MGKCDQTRNTYAVSLVTPIMTTPIKVDIWSDVACPWCYIGKRKFEAGAAQFDGEVEIEYHSYQLAPEMPAEFDGTQLDYFSQFRNIPADQGQQMLDRVTGAASEVGLNYDYDALQPTNTSKAHQLLHFAKSQGRQVEMKERLLKAYFEEGKHVGRDEELADLAAEIGLDRGAALAALQDESFLDDVQADIAAGSRGRRHWGAVLRDRWQVRPFWGTGCRDLRSGTAAGQGRAGAGGMTTPQPAATQPSTPAFTILGDPNAVVCEGDSCTFPTPSSTADTAK